MLTQIQIYADPGLSQKEKGDYFELLLRLVMERQRYTVTERIRFTGTEIDLLCQHRDRPSETALVECKARASIISDDIKGFCFNIIVAKKARIGFFVHTSEISGEAAGLVQSLKQEYPDQLIFWGPDKIIELLQDCGAIVAPPTSIQQTEMRTPTKRILLYTYREHFWVTVYTNKIVPTHYHLTSASSININIDPEVIDWISKLDELQNLQRVDIQSIATVKKPDISFDAVAEIQEAEQWDDYRPVGAKYFVGRSDIRQELYQFVQNPKVKSSSRRIFFIEGKSGWGKSSILAQLRARSKNRRNRHVFYVLAVDCRSANTADFVSLAMAKMVAKASELNFIPEKHSKINVTSAYDILASEEMQSLLTWLKENKRILVIVFDQFEDIFRKEDLFRAFHKLMLDINNQQGFLVIGFSWKSEINIPIDNPAYGLWQQARSMAETYRLEEFLGFEVDQVLRQLEQQSGQVLPIDLKRKIKESSQGFPWLTKKLSIHCYRQIKSGVVPEDLVDQNLNVSVLFNDDEETLTTDEARALRMIAQRGYEGNPFDVAEVDDKIQESEIYSLLIKRLIVRSGGKYNVYWDVFRDYLVEGKVPLLGESFLLRQYPPVCERTLQFIIENSPCTLDSIMSGVEVKSLKEGTVLNRVRELRYIGAINKIEDLYYPRPSIKSIDNFKSYMAEHLNAHIVVRALSKLSQDSITQDDVIVALKNNFKGYGFSKNTWKTYANYLIAWLKYAGIDFGYRLQQTGNSGAFTPQWRPDKDIGLFISFKGSTGPILRKKAMDKGLYDLKALGLLTYEGQYINLSKRGLSILKMDELSIPRKIAEIAIDIPKIVSAYEALFMNSNRVNTSNFAARMAPHLSNISSAMYRKVTLGVLKSWARFIARELRGLWVVTNLGEKTK